MKSNTIQLDPSLFQLSAGPSKDTSTAAEIQPLTAPAPMKSSSAHKTPVKPTPKKVAAKKVSAKKEKKKKNTLDEDVSVAEVKPKEEDEKPEKQGNHIWTKEERITLLSLMLDQVALGKGTDNGNLKGEGWSQVAKEMKAEFGIEFQIEHLKNQKNDLRKIFINTEFLRNQSGFGWDDSTKMITADSDTWDELIRAHPKKKLAKLRLNPIEWYDLGYRLFTGTYAKGKTALRPGELPVSPSDPINESSGNQSGLSGLSANSIKRRQSKWAKKEDTSSDDDAVKVVEPCTRTPAPKRIRGSKYDIFKSGVESIVGAIRETGTVAPDVKPIKADDEEPKPNIEPVKNRLVCQEALDLMASMFLAEVSTHEYVQYITVVESEANAEIFISLASSTNVMVCKAWLDNHLSA
ncbi:hypothetical protein MJO29_012888 [Puccinia striiformis f. sp. tritici]|nr:hypothetical protein MJO29_012888 [Puccinia striiformis f. sp. tritici]